MFLKYACGEWNFELLLLVLSLYLSPKLYLALKLCLAILEPHLDNAAQF